MEHSSMNDGPSRPIGGGLAAAVGETEHPEILKRESLGRQTQAR